MIVFSMKGYVQRVQFTNGNVNEYVYGADGRKLRATYRTAIPGIVVPTGDRHTLTDSELDEEITVRYVDGFEVVGNWDCANYFFGNGYLDCDTRQHYNFHFFAKDHLGSTRAVFHSDGTLENVYDYQTYGNDMCDWGNRLEAMTHKYNGKELETRNGLNLYLIQQEM
ncbi:MAG: hypothetical protein SPF56_09020 [Bacteroidaceae bacterium]|nr:hypothetical protein [Prevotellaceae bacterium]MDY5632610.1 hypothetical protein [Bacteroidaceae bacterium]